MRKKFIKKGATQPQAVYNQDVVDSLSSLVSNAQHVIDTQHARIRYLETKLRLSQHVIEGLLALDYNDGRGNLREYLETLFVGKLGCEMCYNGWVDEVTESGEVVRVLCSNCIERIDK